MLLFCSYFQKVLRPGHAETLSEKSRAWSSTQAGRLVPFIKGSSAIWRLQGGKQLTNGQRLSPECPSTIDMNLLLLMKVLRGGGSFPLSKLINEYRATWDHKSRA